MEFRVLGPLEVGEGKWTADLGPRKQRCLLARLIVDANRVVSLDAIIESLWLDDAPDAAAPAVHVYISRLRRALRGPDENKATSRIQYVGLGYVLRVEDE